MPTSQFVMPQIILAIKISSVAIFLMRDQLQNVDEIGYLGLFLLCFLSNATVLLPAPSLMIAASCALILNPLLVAAVAALGSSLGELVGYAFGKNPAGNTFGHMDIPLLTAATWMRPSPEYHTSWYMPAFSRTFPSGTTGKISLGASGYRQNKCLPDRTEAAATAPG